MKKTTIQHIKAAAAKLRENHLQRLSCKGVSLLIDNVIKALNLSDKSEVVMFIAIFDRSCAGRRSDLDDIASYYGCQQLDVMEYVPSLLSLISKGLVVQTNPSELRLGQRNFMVTNYVMECVLDSRPVDCSKKSIAERKFDRYDFCTAVDQQVQDDDVTAEALFQFVKASEDENPGIPFLEELTKILPGLTDRALFYEICYDHFNNGGNLASSVESTLSDMYERYGMRMIEQRRILDGSHPLISKGLVRLTGDRKGMRLTVPGQRLFLGEDFSTFGRQYNGLNAFTMAHAVHEFVNSEQHDIESSNAMEVLDEKINLIEDSNAELPAVQELRALVDESGIRALFYIVCDACANSDDLSVTSVLNKLYPVNQRVSVLHQLTRETHKLQRLGLVEINKVSSLFGEYNALSLTDKGKTLYFRDEAELFMEDIEGKDLIRCATIKEKHLYFSDKEQTQLSMVENALHEDKYTALTHRLEEKGLSRGIAVLLYGAPGTGKTESVLQWARATGRDIVHVDISQSKSMWYGESEKIIKRIFDRYRRVCSRSGLKPILLFNEADGIFSKRRDIEGARSTDQTENTIQNIILEEMERLDGILIATTNLANNLDKAFERRFLFKIKLERPSVEAKRHIWMDKLPSLAEEEATRLAEAYDFSGGEIDNITRKAVMSEVIEDRKPEIDDIVRLCDEERIGGNRSSMGYKG